MVTEEKIVEELKKRNWHMTCAESCTGGLIAATVVNVSGASEVLNEGYITYSNEAKHRLLGVEETILQTYGAVSRQTAEQMVRGAAKAAKAQVALSATGIAGPGGGTEEKPVGLVYIGCYVDGGVTVTENHFVGDRMQVRRQTVEAALQLLLACLEKSYDE